MSFFFIYIWRINSVHPWDDCSRKGDLLNIRILPIRAPRPWLPGDWWHRPAVCRTGRCCTDCLREELMRIYSSIPHKHSPSSLLGCSRLVYCKDDVCRKESLKPEDKMKQVTVTALGSSFSDRLKHRKSVKERYRRSILLLSGCTVSAAPSGPPSALCSTTIQNSFLVCTTFYYFFLNTHIHYLWKIYVYLSICLCYFVLFLTFSILLFIYLFFAIFILNTRRLAAVAHRFPRSWDIKGLLILRSATKTSLFLFIPSTSSISPPSSPST